MTLLGNVNVPESLPYLANYESMKMGLTAGTGFANLLSILNHPCEILSMRNPPVKAIEHIYIYRFSNTQFMNNDQCARLLLKMGFNPTLVFS